MPPNSKPTNSKCVSKIASNKSSPTSESIASYLLNNLSFVLFLSLSLAESFSPFLSLYYFSFSFPFSFLFSLPFLFLFLFLFLSLSLSFSFVFFSSVDL